MKIALLGDIHGNAAALRAVLAAVDALGINQLLITGDLVGYYFEPAEVVRLLKPYEHHLVRGNHEDMLCAARAKPEVLNRISKKYGSGIEIALAQLEVVELDRLCALPHPLALEVEGCNILLCHGSPWDNDQYVYPDAPNELFDRFSDPAIDLVVTGHTHYSMTKSIGTTLLVNPGSVGQPRDRIPGAHWALFDTETRSVEHKREDYDFGPLVAECQRRHPEIPYLHEVLGRTP